MQTDSFILSFGEAEVDSDQYYLIDLNIPDNTTQKGPGKFKKVRY